MCLGYFSPPYTWMSSHTHIYAHITTQCTEGQENKFQVLGYKIACYKKNKAPKLVHLVCCCFFLNLTPAFSLPLLGTAESCVSCQEGAGRLLPTWSSPSGCFPPTFPAWLETPRSGFSPLVTRRKWLKRDADHKPGRKKKVINIPT